MGDEAIVGSSHEWGERLPGGNVGGAWRVGDTVRRPTGPWPPAVHAPLGHLRGRLDGAPASRGIDGHGREVLDFPPGRIADVDTEELADRLRLLAASYDDVTPRRVLAAVFDRIQASIDGIEHGAAAGDEGMRNLMATAGEPEPTRRALRTLRRRRSALESLL